MYACSPSLTRSSSVASAESSDKGSVSVWREMAGPTYAVVLEEAVGSVCGRSAPFEQVAIPMVVLVTHPPLQPLRSESSLESFDASGEARVELASHACG